MPRGARPARTRFAAGLVSDLARFDHQVFFLGAKSSSNLLEQGIPRADAPFKIAGDVPDT